MKYRYKTLDRKEKYKMKTQKKPLQATVKTARLKTKENNPGIPADLQNPFCLRKVF